MTTGAPPRTLRAALGLWSALAAFLIVQTVFTFAGSQGLRRQLVEQHVVAPERADVALRQLLLLNAGVAVVFAVGYAAVAWFVSRRRPSARLVATGLVVAQVVLTLGTLSLSAVNAIVLVLAVAALACSWTRSSSEWLTGEHE